tara:strand:+ start:6651 stop:7031 length:381 start_codon:yes stop_codon:yes gene_type:complete
MPKMTYTTSKGLVQSRGSGAQNLYYMNPGSTTGSGAGAVPITHAYVAMTAGGTVAWTIADGLPGQVLQIYSVDANTGTLTPDTSTGWATIVFTDIGDRAVLQYIDDTIGWIILSLSGVSAPPTSTV